MKKSPLLLTRLATLGLITMAGLSISHAAQTNKTSDFKVTPLIQMGQEQVFQKELDYLFDTFPPERKKELSQPSVRKSFLEDMLNQWVVSKIAKSKYSNSSSQIDEKIGSYFKRELARYYYQRSFQENLGFTENELLKTFNEEKSKQKWSDDFEANRSQVAIFMATQNDRLNQFVKSKNLFNGILTDSNRTKAQKNFIAFIQDSLMTSGLKTLKLKYGIKEFPAQYPSPADFYNKNPQEFKKAPQYHLYHIENKDSTALSSALQINDFKKWKSLANKMNTSRYSKSEGGDLGWIKANKTLPYDLGDLDSLKTALQNPKKGVIAKIFKANNSMYQVYWLDSVRSERILPLSEVQWEVTEKIKLHPLPPTPTDTLVTSNGKLLLKGQDLIQIQNEIPANQKNIYPRERLVDYLIQWELGFLAAQDAQYNKHPKMITMAEVFKQNFWAELYRDSVFSQNLGLSDSTLKVTFNKYQKQWVDKKFEDVKNEVALLTLASPFELKYEFLKNNSNYGQDTSTTKFEENKVAIFNKIRSKEYPNIQMRHLYNVANVSQMRILDTVSFYKRLPNSSEYLKQFKILQKSEQINDALFYLKRLIQLFPESKEVDTSLYNLGQIYIEQKDFENALEAFDKEIIMFPKSNIHDKALFMKAFIYSEHINNDSLALQTYDQLLKLHPKSDLAKDADFMARDIRSGRKLSEELLNKLDNPAVPPQSTSPEKK